MRQQYRPICIFSVYQHRDTEADKQNHQQTITQLAERKIPYREFIGMFEGKREQSLFVYDDNESIVRTLCLIYEQSSYLYADNERMCQLRDHTGKTIDTLGRLVVDHSATDNYNQDPVTGEKWTTR